jgi:hypothetical protein
VKHNEVRLNAHDAGKECEECGGLVAKKKNIYAASGLITFLMRG